MELFICCEHATSGKTRVPVMKATTPTGMFELMEGKSLNSIGEANTQESCEGRSALQDPKGAHPISTRNCHMSGSSVESHKLGRALPSCGAEVITSINLEDRTTAPGHLEGKV